jgi:hypothetical protein
MGSWMVPAMTHNLKADPEFPPTPLPILVGGFLIQTQIFLRSSRDLPDRPLMLRIE